MFLANITQPLSPLIHLASSATSFPLCVSSSLFLRVCSTIFGIFTRNGRRTIYGCTVSQRNAFDVLRWRDTRAAVRSSSESNQRETNEIGSPKRRENYCICFNCSSGTVPPLVFRRQSLYYTERTICVFHRSANRWITYLQSESDRIV